MSTLRGVVKDQLVRSASSILMEENRQFLATLTIVQVYKDTWILLLVCDVV